MRVQRELLMVRLRLMADFNWRARVARGPVGCKLEGRDELPVLADCSCRWRVVTRTVSQNWKTMTDVRFWPTVAGRSPGALGPNQKFTSRQS